MWKDFFYYTKSERRAIICLSCLGILLLIYQSWQFGNNQTVFHQVDSLSLDSFQVEVYHKKQERDSLRFKSFKKTSRTTPVLTTFDPNIADSTLLCQLGLPSFLASRILRYREKGGMFKNADDFSHIYGLTEKQFITLKPYIKINQELLIEKSNKNKVKRLVHQEDSTNFAEIRQNSINTKYPVGTVLDLNTADTTELKRIPGIGKGLANMIVTYRNRLGGFSRVEQLQEIDHIDQSINKWFTVKATITRKIRINHDGLDKLRNHPYMNFYKAKVILEYRRKRGKIKGLPQLSMFQEFTEEDLQKLKPYLDFE